MIKKSKKNYPEEDIIDGFSILCFDKYKNLKKYTNSSNAVNRKVVLNVINSCNELQRNSMSLNSKKRIITKKHRFESTPPLKPTRITAKRKSKPDMSILAITISKKKRKKRIQTLKTQSEFNAASVTQIIIDVDKNNSVLNSFESDSKYSDIKGECLDEFSTFDKLTEVSGKCDSGITEEYSNNSLGENSTTGNSTSSPMSLQPIYFEDDSPELVFSDKVDIDKDSDDSNTKSHSTPDNFHVNVHIGPQTTELVDDDCVILSVGFDPDPKLTNIPVTSHEVPVLHAAPQSSCPASIAAFVVSNPPPLTPAPDMYFSSLRHDSKVDIQSNNSDSSSKFQSRKRSQLKASSMKSPSKHVKPSQSPSPIKPNYRSQFPANVDESLFKLYPIPVSSLTAPPTLPTTPISIASKTILPNPISCKFKLPKPMPIYCSDTKQMMVSSNRFSQCLMRRTACQVHIAQLIHKRFILDHRLTKAPPNTSPLTKLRPLIPISQSLSRSNSLSSLNLNSSAIDSHMNPQNHYNNPQAKSTRPINTIKSPREVPIFIRPLHKTYLAPNSFSDQVPSARNIFPRENVLVLK